MKAPPLEKDIEAAVCKRAREMGCLVYKFTSPSQRAVPDRMFILPGGRVVFIEFKRPGCKLSTAQARELGKMQAQGSLVICIDSVAKGVGWLEHLTTDEQ